MSDVKTIAGDTMSVAQGLAKEKAVNETFAQPEKPKTISDELNAKVKSPTSSGVNVVIRFQIGKHTGKLFSGKTRTLADAQNFIRVLSEGIRVMIEGPKEQGPAISIPGDPRTKTGIILPEGHD